MDKIKAYIEAISLVSIFAGVVGALIPSGKLKRAFSAFCGAVIVFSAVSSVAELKGGGIDFWNYDAQESERMLLSDLKTAEVSVYEGVLASGVEKALEEYGYIAQVKAFCEKEGEEMRVVSFVVHINADENARSNIEAYLKTGFGDIVVKFEEAYSSE